VLAYVLLTGRQPFSSPKTDDPMVVMRRIVDDNWHIKYPPYLSAAAKVHNFCSAVRFNHLQCSPPISVACPDKLCSDKCVLWPCADKPHLPCNRT
jgi:hypothetical protein